MFGRKQYPGLRGILREMMSDGRFDDSQPADVPSGGNDGLRTPEKIDREIASEEAEIEDENRVVDPIEEGSERAAAELREAAAIHRDLIVGCVALGLLLLAGMIWARPAWRYALGVAAGTGVAVYLLVHMYRSIGWELTMEPGQAERYARGRSVRRYLVVALSAVAVFLALGKAAGVGCLLAVVTIKPSAYMQPLTAGIRRKLGFRK